MPQALSNLAVGSKVKFGKYQVNTETAQPIIWTIVAKNHQCTPAYPENAITLHATEILDLRCFDAKEPNSGVTNIKNYGNSYYPVSNIDQWLNKDAGGGLWYVAAHDTDNSPSTSGNTGGFGTQYASRPGFLNMFSDEEKTSILTTTIRAYKTTAYSYVDIERKVFLPSATEVGLSHTYTEGQDWGYYTSNDSRIGNVTQQCFTNTKSDTKPSTKNSAKEWWLRTHSFNSAYNSSYVAEGGTDSAYYACWGNYGVRPALNLPSTLTVSDTTDSDGCYTFVWTSPTDYTFTLNGTQYTNVAKINYVSGDTTKQIKKLVVNGSTVWQA